MVTSQQIRSARAALKMSVEELGRLSGVSTSTIKRIEAKDGQPSSTLANMSLITAALEAAGIEFIGSPDNAPGIRIHPRPDQISDD
ncbi:MAG: helix-turn-helix transcriptional regulator [Pseudomonadota bacterium]